MLLIATVGLQLFAETNKGIAVNHRRHDQQRSKVRTSRGVWSGYFKIVQHIIFRK
jgi:hypothetical protein